MALPRLARAEAKAGTAAQIIRAVDLRKRSEDDSASLGRLPKGTIVSLTGEIKNGYVAVEVELEEGSISGWVPRTALNRQARENLPEDPRSMKEDEDEEIKRPKRSDESDDEEPVVIRPRSRIKVPKDEGLLMRRDPSFFYGVHVGGGAAILNASAVTGDMFVGPAIVAGGQVGYHISRNIPVRLELSYLSVSGSEPQGQSMSFGFADIGGYVSYFIDDFEVFAGASYAYGISVGDLPKQILNNTAPDFSSLFFAGGVGYKINLGEVTDLVLRVRYNVSFMRDPLATQTIQAIGYLEFRG